MDISRILLINKKHIIIGKNQHFQLSIIKSKPDRGGVPWSGRRVYLQSRAEFDDMNQNKLNEKNNENKTKWIPYWQSGLNGHFESETNAIYRMTSA